MAPGKIAGTVEPTASMGVAPRNRMSGVVMTAPPTPSTDAKMPEQMPATNTITVVTQLIARPNEAHVCVRSMSYLFGEVRDLVIVSVGIGPSHLMKTERRVKVERMLIEWTGVHFQHKPRCVGMGFDVVIHACRQAESLVGRSDADPIEIHELVKVL